MNRRAAQVALIGAVLLAAGAQARASVAYLGGRVIPTIRIIPIYYGSSWTTTDKNSTQAYLTDLASYINGGMNPAGQQTVYAQYGITGASLDPIRSVAASPAHTMQLPPNNEIPNIVESFRIQNGLSYSAAALFLLLPGPGYTVPSGQPCSGHYFNTDGQYYAFATRDCAQVQISREVLGAAASANSDGWLGPLDPCPGQVKHLAHGDVALPWDNVANQCSTTGFDNKASQILQMVITDVWGGLLHTIRHDTYWDPFGDVKAAVGSDPGVLGPVDTQATLGVFNHVIALTQAGKLVHTIRTDLAWTPFVDVSAATGASDKVFVSVQLANVNGDLHACAMTGTGRVWHAIRSQNGSWSSFGDVLLQTGAPPTPPVIQIDCAAIGSEMHIVMMTASRRLFHAFRFPTGWTGLDEIAEGSIGTPTPTGFTVANFLGELNLTVATTSSQFNSIRHSNGWSAFTILPDSDQGSRLSTAGTPDALHLVYQNKKGGVSHRTHDTIATWGAIGDVCVATGNCPPCCFYGGIGATSSLGF